MKVPLTGGAYQSRNLIANAQRCVNLYTEINPEDSPFPTTHYLTPGLKVVATSAGLGWRALYTTTTGVLYGVAGSRVYRVASNFVLTDIGGLATSFGPASMVDNGLDVVLVDGSGDGKRINLATGVMTTINNHAFYGANRVDLVDGFLIFNRPATNQFYISKFLDIDFDSLDFAAKTGFADKIVAVAATRRQVFIFGTQTTEIWYNTGEAAFPFGRMPGAFIQHGCISAASIAQADGSIYWLSLSPQGECLVLRTEGYDRARVSTYAIEKEFQGYARVDDAWGYCYQQEGHIFYVLNFPSADKTWVYDIASSQWHERMWLDDEGVEHRHRAACFAFFEGQAIVGDWENGKLYRMGLDLLTDDSEEIRRIRAFPHLVDDGNRVMYRGLIADMQVGTGQPASLAGAEVRLRWSDTRGASWGNSITDTLAPSGNYQHSIKFNRLGMARDRVFELSWAAESQTALNGVFIHVEPAAS